MCFILSWDLLSPLLLSGIIFRTFGSLKSCCNMHTTNIYIRVIYKIIHIEDVNSTSKVVTSFAVKFYKFDRVIVRELNRINVYKHCY